MADQQPAAASHEQARRTFLTKRRLLDSFRIGQDARHSTIEVDPSNVVRVFRLPAGDTGASGEVAAMPPHHAFLSFRGRTYPCAIGRAGMAPLEVKREGDGCTPIATLPVRGAWLRTDRVAEAVNIDSTAEKLFAAKKYPVLPIAPDDIWIDEGKSSRYNTYASLSEPTSLEAGESFEHLSLKSRVYDACFVLGYNDAPVAPAAGSAIFFHLASVSESTPAAASNSNEAASSTSSPDYSLLARANNYSATAGCVAVSREHMDDIRASFDCDTLFKIALREEDTLGHTRARRAAASVATTSAAQSSAPALFQKHFAEATTAPPSDGSVLPAGVQFAQASDRNKEAIATALRELIGGDDDQGEGQRVLEVSSGSGQHCGHFAATFPRATFQPTDQSEDGFISIAYHTRACSNVLAPVRVDLLESASYSSLPAQSFTALFVANMLHISEAGTTEGLFRVASHALANVPQARVLVYGPFMVCGEPTTDSNRAFHEKLRSMNPAYGLRDTRAVAESAIQFGFHLHRVQDMPANNFLLVFARSPISADVEHRRLDGTSESFRGE